MKKNIVLCVVLLIIYAGLNADCTQNCCIFGNEFYGEIFGGPNFLQSSTDGGVRTKYKTGYVVSGSFGYSWCYGLRLEAEYAYRRNSYKNIHFFGRTFPIQGHFQSSSYMANLLWDLPLSSRGCNCWQIQPFIGGGVGYDVQQIHANNAGFGYRESKKGFAWQVSAGLAYPIFCNTTISIEYQFHKGSLNHIYNHTMGIGFTYHR